MSQQRTDAEIAAATVAKATEETVIEKRDRKVTGGTRSAARTEFLSDIVIGAVEGGTGYWAQVAAYKWEGVESAYAVLIEEEEAEDVAEFAQLFAEANGRKIKLSELVEEAGGVYKLDIDVVAKGLGKIKRGEVGVNSAIKESIVLGDRENDAGYIDADGADVIVQAGLFGKVVYG